MTKGFISYAHDDHDALQEMLTYLGPLARTFDVNFWHDERIVAGDYWRGEIQEAIEAARIHLLLVTPSFINRPYIMDHELPAINAKYHDTSDLVIPVVHDRCTWQPFVDAIQAVPISPQRRLLPVTEWKPQRHGFHAACEQIERAIAKFLGTEAAPPFSWRRGA